MIQEDTEDDSDVIEDGHEELAYTSLLTLLLQSIIIIQANAWPVAMLLK